MKQLRKSQSWLLLAAIAGGISLNSCKKESIAPATADAAAAEAATTEAATDDAVSEAVYDDVFNITGSMGTNQVGEELGLGGGLPGPFMNMNGPGEGPDSPDSAARCYTVTVIPNIPHVFPKTVTINFGDGCVGRDGKLRKGKIVSIYTAPMRVPGSKVSTTFIGYSVDSFQAEGTHITENTSTSNLQGWKTTVLDGKITNTNTGKWRKWNSLKQVTQTEGNGTPAFPWDDVFKITGGAKGSNSLGHTWTATVVDPLIKKFNCRWIVKGTVKIVRDGKEALLDYGNGNCDNKAVIIINGIPRPITL